MAAVVDALAAEIGDGAGAVRVREGSDRELADRAVANVASGGVCGVLRCPAVALKLFDAKRGLVAYQRAGKLRLLRLRDGVNRVVASAVDARFGDNGLFHAFKTTGAWPSRVRFVPWATLPVRP